MIFDSTGLLGSFIIDVEPYEDFRGLFARTVCCDEFKRHGLNADFVQQSVSFNPKIGTLRGMHWQIEPFAEEKLVRVTRGSVYDVIVDIRRDSSTFLKWFAVELSADNHRAIYVPKGFAHGFQTLEPNSEVLYEMTARYDLDSSRGFVWSDPEIGIEWPEVSERIVGIRDAQYPPFNSAI